MTEFLADQPIEAFGANENSYMFNLYGSSVLLGMSRIYLAVVCMESGLRLAYAAGRTGRYRFGRYLGERGSDIWL